VAFEFDADVLYPATASSASSSSQGGASGGSNTPTEPTTPRSFFSRFMSPKHAPPQPSPNTATTTNTSNPSLVVRPKSLLIQMTDDVMASGVATTPSSLPSSTGAASPASLASTTSNPTLGAGGVAAQDPLAAAYLIRTEPHGNLRGLIMSREFRAIVPAVIPLVDAIDQNTMRAFLLHVFNCGVTAAGGSFRLK
jgi:hypothetical protein